MNKLDFLFSFSRNQASATLSVPLPDPTVHGIRVTCKDLAVLHPGILPIFEHFNLEVTSGEKIGGYANTAAAKTALAQVLAGLEVPTGGVLRHINLQTINRCRGFMIDSSSPCSKA